MRKKQGAVHPLTPLRGPTLGGETRSQARDGVLAKVTKATAGAAESQPPRGHNSRGRSLTSGLTSLKVAIKPSGSSAVKVKKGGSPIQHLLRNSKKDVGIDPSQEIILTTSTNFSAFQRQHQQLIDTSNTARTAWQAQVSSAEDLDAAKKWGEDKNTSDFFSESSAWMRRWDLCIMLMIAVTGTGADCTGCLLISCHDTCL